MSKKAPENVPVEKLRAIWQQVAANDWLNLFQELRPSHKWTLSGDVIKAQCIYHADNDPSMTVNLERKLVHCFGCHRTVYNPIRFVADLGQIGNSAALSKLKNRFGIRLPAAYMQNLQQIEDNQQLKFALLRVMNDELVDAICNPDKPEYAYIRDSKLLDWLGERKIPTDAAHVWPVGVLMPQERMAERLENMKRADLVESAYRYFVGEKNNYLAAPGAKRVHEGSAVFFYFTSPTTVGRIRIRHPGTKDIYAIEDAYENEFGIFGINTFSELLGKLEKRPLVCVEGEMDALSHIAHQASEGTNDVCVAAIGGGMGAGSDLDAYVDFGFKEGWIGPDNDADGVGFARKILTNNSRFRRVFSWTDDDSKRTVKDIDQAYRVYGFAPFYERLCNTESFVRNYDWAVDQSSREIENIESGDVRARTESASEFGAILRDESERNVYVEKMCSVYGLDKELIRQGMLPDDDDEDSFRQRLTHKLRTDEYFFLTEKQLGGSPIVMVWSRRKKVMRTFAMNSISSVMGTLSLDIGLPELYIQRELGEPAHLQYTLNPKGEPVRLNSLKKTQLINKAFFEAVTVCIDSAMPLERLVELDQGYHYIRETVDTGEPVVFIVNGANFFKGTFAADNTLHFEKLDCPVHGEYFFRLRSKPWSRDLTSLESIEEGKTVDLKEVFETIRDILDIGWQFKDHDLTIDYLTADIMYTTIATAFEHMVLTSVGGQSQSGKSTFMQVVGGRAYPDLKLCDATVVQDDFSAASIRQAMSGSSLRLLLDEFEDSNFGSFRPERKARVVREIQDLFRTISTGTDAYRGSVNGEAMRFFLYFPVIIGGIFSLKETRDVNRYVRVRTKHISGYQNPVEMIRRKYTYEDIRALRRKITLCLIARTNEVIQTQRELQQEFGINGKLEAGTDDRLKQNLLPATTILKLVGKDYVDFMVRFAAIKMEEMAEQGATQESASIWNSILNTPIHLSAHDPSLSGTATVARMLGDPHFEGFLNGTDVGVYYVPEKKWLIVHWHKVVSGVMRNDNTYRGTQYPGRLKFVADEDSRVVLKSKISKRFLQSAVWPRVGAKVSLHDISIIDVRDTIVTRHYNNQETNDKEERLLMMNDIPGGNGASTAEKKNVTEGNFKQ